jgi:hypothetical protein
LIKSALDFICESRLMLTIPVFSSVNGQWSITMSDCLKTSERLSC